MSLVNFFFFQSKNPTASFSRAKQSFSKLEQISFYLRRIKLQVSPQNKKQNKQESFFFLKKRKAEKKKENLLFFVVSTTTSQTKNYFYHQNQTCPLGSACLEIHTLENLKF